jgi:hypothetical protein
MQDLLIFLVGYLFGASSVIATLLRSEPAAGRKHGAGRNPASFKDAIATSNRRRRA